MQPFPGNPLIHKRKQHLWHGTEFPKKVYVPVPCRNFCYTNPMLSLWTGKLNYCFQLSTCSVIELSGGTSHNMWASSIKTEVYFGATSFWKPCITFSLYVLHMDLWKTLWASCLFCHMTSERMGLASCYLDFVPTLWCTLLVELGGSDCMLCLWCNEAWPKCLPDALLEWPLSVGEEHAPESWNKDMWNRSETSWKPGVQPRPARPRRAQSKETEPQLTPRSRSIKAKVCFC